MAHIGHRHLLRGAIPPLNRTDAFASRAAVAEKSLASRRDDG
jgi:hypothetical protein